jgi:hypothetical protein
MSAPSASGPRAAAPYARYAGSTSIDHSRRGRTTTPEPRRVATTPHSDSRESASRTVGRLAPTATARSRSDGNFAPGTYSPDTISRTSRSNTALDGDASFRCSCAMWSDQVVRPLCGRRKTEQV